MRITVRKESITRLLVDGIVNPANSFGFMGGGVAEVIKKVGGQSIEDEAIENAPVEIGTALATEAGDLRCSCVIHSPTMREPAQKTDVKCVGEATRAALELADEMGLRKIAIPGMGTGVGGVDKDAAAQAMISVIMGFEASNIEEVVLVDIDDEMVAEWKKALG